MLPFFGFLMPIISGTAWTHFLAKQVSNAIISKKISENVEEIRNKIKDRYLIYCWNMLITIVLNILLIGITFISYYFFTINEITIYIISTITIFMIIRTILNFMKFMIKTIIPHWHKIIYYTRIFFSDLFGGCGISGSIKNIIHVTFSNIYYGNTNSFGRGIHTVFSILKFVKSYEEISEEIQDEFYRLITGYAVRNIAYKIIAFLVYCTVFTFILRPFIFSYTMQMNIFQVVFYPFTVALPKVIGIFKGGT